MTWRPVSLKSEPGVDRAEDRPLRPLDVAQQPLDLGRREVGVDRQPGPLAHQRLVPGRAQLVAALGGATVLPDQRAVDRLAARRVPGDDGLALVGDPDPVELGALDPGVGDRLGGDPPRHLPDLARRRARPSPAAGSAARTPSRRARRSAPSPSKTRQVVPVVPWSIARIKTASLLAAADLAAAGQDRGEGATVGEAHRGVGEGEGGAGEAGGRVAGGAEVAAALRPGR